MLSKVPKTSGGSHHADLSSAAVGGARDGVKGSWVLRVR